jgi:hypothetical protein
MKHTANDPLQLTEAECLAILCQTEGNRNFHSAVAKLKAQLALLQDERAKGLPMRNMNDLDKVLAPSTTPTIDCPVCGQTVPVRYQDRCITWQISTHSVGPSPTTCPGSRQTFRDSRE